MPTSNSYSRCGARPGRAFFEKGNPIFGHPEVNYFAKKVSGHMVLLELIEAVTGPDLMPQSRATKIDLVALGEHCGVSRVHVTKIIAGAAERGLVVVEGPGGSAIRPTELLIQKFLEWAAMQFAFFTDSAIDAMKERAAHASSRRAARASRPPRSGPRSDINGKRDSPPVRRAQSEPFILDLIEVDGGIVWADREAELRRRQAADRRQQSVGSDDLVALRGDQLDPRAQEASVRR